MALRHCDVLRTCTWTGCAPLRGQIARCRRCYSNPGFTCDCNILRRGALAACAKYPSPCQPPTPSQGPKRALPTPVQQLMCMQ
eukprot:2566565-Pyramimonas_sp.AAC.1